MPAYTDREARRLYMRAYRARKKAEREAVAKFANLANFDLPADPVGALAEWAAKTLIVPPGHPMAGRPMALPDFAEAFLREGWGAHESALCIARKNAKSAIAAVLALGHLCGPAAL